jgi:serine/threonine protein kinase
MYLQNRDTIEQLFHHEPVFIQSYNSPDLRVWNMWAIASHISRGLAFIREKNFSHMDLKHANGYPRLYPKLTIVLYSHTQKVWKIVDFGITSAMSVSKPAVTTAYGRGSSGFRAPEPLSEEPRYSIKVDIWALGCILFQLCTNTPLFSNDFAVRDFENSNKFNLLEMPCKPQHFVKLKQLCQCY